MFKRINIFSQAHLVYSTIITAVILLTTIKRKLIRYYSDL